MVHRKRHQLSSGVKAEFLADVSTVIAHREDTQVQGDSYLLTRLSLANVLEDFFFFGCKKTVLLHLGVQ
jgi:hypothetical protein